MIRTTNPGPDDSGHRSVARRRSVQFTAVALTVGVTVGAIVSAGGGTAGATAYEAQSVGNFVDATAGGMTLDPVVKLQYATAFAPGSQSAQNPLSAKALNMIDVPLTNAIKLPSFAGIKLGAVNQVAVAHASGRAYGASGAVSNSGGASVGGNDNAFPANATIDLTAAGLAGNLPISLPGGGSLDSLGGVTASIGGVSALARTNSSGQALTPKYTIADLDLTLGSPALGSLLGTLEAQAKPLTTLVSSLTTLLGQTALPASCALSLDKLPSTIRLDKGAVVIDPSTATITIDLDKFLKQLGLNLNHLPANTDLVTYLSRQLPTILTTGLEGVVDGIITPLETQFTNCTAALNGLPLLGPLLTTVLSALTTGEKTIEGTVNTIAKTVSKSGSSGIGALTDSLKNLIDIGINVEHGPGKAANNSVAPYHSNLLNTPKQGTAVVPHQTLVRAIEIDLLSTSALTSNSAGQHQIAGARGTATLVSASAAVSIALGNAAAGPSTPVVASTPTPTPTTFTPTTLTPTTAVPTGVPAGAAGHSGGSPVLPIVLLLLGLSVAGGGVLSYRMRRGFRH